MAEYDTYHDHCARGETTAVSSSKTNIILNLDGVHLLSENMASIAMQSTSTTLHLGVVQAWAYATARAELTSIQLQPQL